MESLDNLLRGVVDRVTFRLPINSSLAGSQAKPTETSPFDHSE